MKNAYGKLLTYDKDIMDEAVKHYKGVFEETPIDEDLIDYKREREELCA